MKLLAAILLALVPGIAHAGFLLGYVLGSSSSSSSSPAPTVPAAIGAPYQVPPGATVVTCTWVSDGCLFEYLGDSSKNPWPCTTLKEWGLVTEIDKKGNCDKPWSFRAKPEHLVGMLTNRKSVLLEWFILSSSDAQGNIHYSALIVYK